MLTTLTIAFFLFYFSIGTKITNKKIKKLKQEFDYFTFKNLKKFAISSNKVLFDSYYKICIKLLRAFLISAMLLSLIGFKPIHSAYLLVFTALLLISFTSAKQYKLDLIENLTLLMFIGIAFSSIWFIYPSQLQELNLAFSNDINLTASALGITKETLLILLAATLLYMVFSKLILWLVMKTLMEITFTIFKGFAKLSFWLNKRRPMAAAHLMISIVILIIVEIIQRNPKL
ncbi:MAG TPA: hypothetical protein VKX40_02925 [Aequorivita sp.]|nr:hypothetical protein [Aequorivita sp.]